MTQVRRKTWLVLWTLLVAASVLVSAQDVEKTLNAKYKDQILALRHPRQVNKQEYDSAGAVVGDNAEGPWTLYGRIRVNDISLHADKLDISGKRVWYFADKKTGELAPIKERDRVKLSIRLGKPLESADEATAVLGRVFALSSEELVKSAPEYWRGYLAAQSGAPGAAKVEPVWDRSKGAKKAWSSKGQAATPLNVPGIGEVFNVGEDVKAPHVIRQREPEYSKEARAEKRQGTLGMNIIVDKTGVVRRPQIVRPLGLGLDDRAVETVSTWRFESALLNGEPVAVMVYVEVGFHLY